MKPFQEYLSLWAVFYMEYDLNVMVLNMYSLTEHISGDIHVLFHQIYFLTCFQKETHFNENETDNLQFELVKGKKVQD